MGLLAPAQGEGRHGEKARGSQFTALIEILAPFRLLIGRAFPAGYRRSPSHVPVRETQTRLTLAVRRSPLGPSTGTCQACPGGIQRTSGFDVTLEASVLGRYSWNVPGWSGLGRPICGTAQSATFGSVAAIASRWLLYRFDYRQGRSTASL